ncbi:hypothetical protein CDL15_Pgr016676 [Punica granatum]|uniref:Uncharacterized protein n=1 Tax=Punica granatum TaxID=22663 RepID=A0A218XT21_PUNGR|nr:hypothetical protein CDL15_Pgr016676 [Punica granatum]
MLLFIAMGPLQKGTPIPLIQRDIKWMPRLLLSKDNGQPPFMRNKMRNLWIMSSGSRYHRNSVARIATLWLIYVA